MDSMHKKFIVMFVVFFHCCSILSTPESPAQGAYDQWKRRVLRQWRKQDILSDLAKKDDLIRMIEPALYMKELPDLIKSHATCAYHFLFSDFQDQDICSDGSAVVEDIKKDRVEKEIKNITYQALSCVWSVYEALEKRSREQDITRKKAYAAAAVQQYNVLRELWRIPKIETRKRIETAWLDEIQLFLENIYYERYDAVTFEHELVRKAQERIGSKEPVIVTRSFTQDSATTFPSGNVNVMSLCPDYDLDILLYTIYHELSHIINKDHLMIWRTKRDIKKPRKIGRAHV
jgi:hypothetical protein